MALDELFTNIVFPLLFIGIPTITLLFKATERSRLHSSSSIENDLCSFGAV